MDSTAEGVRVRRSAGDWTRAYDTPRNAPTAVWRGDVHAAVIWSLWSSDPVSGLFYWTTILLSPETLPFVLFIMPDPVTAPKSARGRIVFGVATALLAAGLLSFRPTEFGVKLAMLTVTSALVPFIEGAVARVRGQAAAPAEPAGRPRSAVARVAQGALRPAVVAARDHRLGRTRGHRPAGQQSSWSRAPPGEANPQWCLNASAPT